MCQTVDNYESLSYITENFEILNYRKKGRANTKPLEAFFLIEWLPKTEG